MPNDQSEIERFIRARAAARAEPGGVMSVEITTLPSGLRIATDRMAYLETASLGVFVGAGSRHERANEHGLSHLLEHMAFKGTRRRSARDIAEEIETVGGDLNAATSTEHTAYYAHILAADVPLALDILADILTESSFDSVELEREKGVILQEIGAVEDTPDDLVFELLNAAAFPDQPIGRPILGTREQVSGFGRDAISAYLATHYRADAMVIGAAGAVEHAALCDEAARRFANLPARGIEDGTARALLPGRRKALAAAARTGPYRHRLRRQSLRARGFLRHADFRERGRRRDVFAFVPGGA